MNNEVKKVLFIINKYSGTGYQPQLEGRILEACRNSDAECTLEFTQGPGHATELAKQGVAEHFDLVVAVGGDGTMNEVAKGLVHSPVTMGIIPRGSGNGLARHLGIPMNTLKAAKMLFDSTPLKIDTFTVNGRFSLNVSGIGFDGQIAKQFGKAGKRGLANYARVALEEHKKFKEFEACITIGERQFTRQAFIIAIANSSQYGNNVRIAPDASICDHKLRISLLRKAPVYRIDFLYAFVAGSISRSKFCEMFETDALTVSLTDPVPYHVDGEPFGEDKNFTIKIQPASLSMLVSPHNHSRV